MTYLQDSIISLRATGKSYKKIAAELGCSIGTVSYYLGDGQKEKAQARQVARRAKSTLVKKTDVFKHSDYRPHSVVPPALDVDVANRFKVLEFCRDRETRKAGTSFTYQDVLDRDGVDPICYLSGRSIDLMDPRSYNLDHIVPRSAGGDSTLENLGIARYEANMAKHGMSLPDFLQLCQEILQHHGYEVKKTVV